MRTRTLILVVVLAALAGCNEETQSKWGKGDPPDQWQETFGNNNTARLDYVQSQLLNSIQRLLIGYNQLDPDGKPILDREGKAARVQGLVEYINGLDARLTALEPDPIERITGTK